MGKQKKNGKKKTSNNNISEQEMIWVDPDRVRFQHSKIRPYFSSCGRALSETLDCIRQGQLDPVDLPPIQVIVFNDDLLI